MCFYYDGYNDLNVTTYPKARKEHRCYECREIIQKGETYVYFKALFDGSFSKSKTCRRCEYLRREISNIDIKRGCRYSESWVPTFELMECLKEYGLNLIPKDQVPESFQLVE